MVLCAGEEQQELEGTKMQGKERRRVCRRLLQRCRGGREWSSDQDNVEGEEGRESEAMHDTTRPSPLCVDSRDSRQEIVV